MHFLPLEDDREVLLVERVGARQRVTWLLLDRQGWSDSIVLDSRQVSQSASKKKHSCIV